jgi:dTDP-4-dehydrorhamnose 3,5-epimerase
MGTLIKGVTITPLKIIANELGSVMHALKKSDDGYVGFGEAYFSTVSKGVVKGWKKHKLMTLNLVVSLGKVRFVIYDDRDDSPTKGIYNNFELSPDDNYNRLTILPGLWVAFEGIGIGTNMLLNLADILHDPHEAENSPVNEKKIPYPSRIE